MLYGFTKTCFIEIQRLTTISQDDRKNKKIHYLYLLNQRYIYI
jgi:hypothetical protein